MAATMKTYVVLTKSNLTLRVYRHLSQEELMSLEFLSYYKGLYFS